MKKFLRILLTTFVGIFIVIGTFLCSLLWTISQSNETICCFYDKISRGN